MADLNEIVEYLDTVLNTAAIKDYPGAMNGLQLANNGEVGRVISAVDASLAVIEEAAGKGGGLLLVHHGMFWQGVKPITGTLYRKIRAAMDGNLAVYSSHLPLDVHPEYGNNLLLAKAIGLDDIAPILLKDGFPMGVAGIFGKSRENLADAVGRAVDREVTVCPGGVEVVRMVAVITGGAGSEVGRIAELGFDAFVTGEGPHWSFIEAEELGLNVIYAGHYATETFGVRAVSAHIAGRFALENCFIRRPGGL
jgi:dinuclear metal center YbgI/SA1388 family protein